MTRRPVQPPLSTAPRSLLPPRLTLSNATSIVVEQQKRLPFTAYLEVRHMVPPKPSLCQRELEAWSGGSSWSRLVTDKSYLILYD
uniref:Uncharacterized protein n=1 Tax=Leersia perrieri TaxID=77586 RepID=A0A0D9WXZ1_9ORYZ